MEFANIIESVRFSFSSSNQYKSKEVKSTINSILLNPCTIIKKKKEKVKRK